MILSRLASILSPARRRRRSVSAADRLENRTLLASLVGGNKVTYQDINGDNVTVTLSKSVLTAGNVDFVFLFSGPFGDAGPQYLQRIDLSSLGGAAGTTITSVATRSATNGGDGFAHIGEIDATGIDLGNVTIDGDLGRIVAGDATLTTQGLGALKVHSMGRFGLLTGASSRESTIQGRLASLTTKSDVANVSISTVGGVSGTVGAVTIGGSMIEATLYAQGDIGLVKITGDLQARISGGVIVTNRKLTGVNIGGSLIGGSLPLSGSIRSDLDMGPVVVTGDVIGGADVLSGSILSGGKLSSVLIGGAVRGGHAAQSGRISSAGDMGSVTIQGDLRGGIGTGSGQVFASTKLASVTVNGTIVGGQGNASGAIFTTADLGTVNVKGNLSGGTGHNSGLISSGNKLTSLTIGGSVVGGTGQSSGSIRAISDVGTIRIARDLRGGDGVNAGSIVTDKLTTLSIGGSILGGTESYTGAVTTGGLGTVTIGGDLVGGNAFGAQPLLNSGSVSAIRIASLSLGGSLIAGTDNTTGSYNSNGAIVASADIGSLTVKGNLKGNATNRAVITAAGQLSPTSTADVAISKLTVNGRVERASILAGFRDQDFPLNADAQIGTVVVTGDWIASDLIAGASPGVDNKYGTLDDAKLSGPGIKDVSAVFSRIASITIGGQVIDSHDDVNDNFGFVAEIIGSFKVKGGSATFPLISGAGNDNFFVSIGTGGFPPDARLRELTF